MFLTVLVNPACTLCRYLRDVLGVLQLRSLSTGELWRELALSCGGSAGSFSGGCSSFNGVFPSRLAKLRFLRRAWVQGVVYKRACSAGWTLPAMTKRCKAPQGKGLEALNGVERESKGICCVSNRGKLRHIFWP